MKRALLLTLILLVTTDISYAQDDEPAPGDSYLDPHGIEQVWVPAGCFTMGTTDEQMEAERDLGPPFWARSAMRAEQPAHEVCLTSGYRIDKTEVTNAAWQDFVDAGGYTTPDLWSESGQAWLADQDVDGLPLDCPNADQPDHPRACITWFEAEAYAAWRGGSLPTEAQWEFAARGPESLIYPWGDEWNPELANVVDSTETTPVGSYPEGASWVGALDMSGNVMEWAADWLDTDYYRESPQDDPPGAAEGRIKVERGGWWGSNSTVARSAYRHFEDPPTYEDHHIGVRIVAQ
jgi:formylglycine-generating enzyme required for sulfatase activity